MMLINRYSRDLAFAELIIVIDELMNNVRYGPQTFNPRFIGPPSQYMGLPNPELDHRWYELSKSKRRSYRDLR